MRNSMVWKFKLDGTLAGTFIHDGGGADYFRDFTVDGTGNVYIATHSDRLLTGTTMWDTYAYDFATAKFASTGTLLWSSRYNNTGTGNHYPTSIAVDATGNVYVTGDSAGDGTTGNDIATVKYNGKTGTQLWANRYNGTANGNDAANSVLIDGSGNVFVTGTSLNVGTGLDYTAIKYASNGSRQWAVTYNKALGVDQTLNSAALDANGQLVLTGVMTDATGIPQLSTLKLVKNQ
jgi:outer membrane protein assembly factor BamB